MCKSECPGALVYRFCVFSLLKGELGVLTPSPALLLHLLWSCSTIFVLVGLPHETELSWRAGVLSFSSFYPQNMTLCLAYRRQSIDGEITEMWNFWCEGIWQWLPGTCVESEVGLSRRILLLSCWCLPWAPEACCPCTVWWCHLSSVCVQKRQHACDQGWRGKDQMNQSLCPETRWDQGFNC